MADETPQPPDHGDAPAHDETATDTTAQQADEPLEEGGSTHVEEAMTDSPEAPVPPISTSLPQATPAPPDRGQRRITRHTRTSTTRSETTTEEVVTEDVALAPPVWAAPAGEHPRPVG